MSSPWNKLLIPGQNTDFQLSKILVVVISLLLLNAGTSAGMAHAQDTAAGAPAGAGQGTPPENPFPQAVPVPEGILDGGTEWLNTGEPLSLRQLRGKVVLIDFWTYCCINCMHVLPDLKYLEEKYGKQLVVIGVHSAKFDNEKVSDNIRNAIMRYEIHHPVVNDSEMLIWRKFGTRAWPTLALIDPEGNYIGSQGGEGNRELFDAVIGKVVEYHRWKGTLDETPLVFRMESDKATPTPLRFPGKVLADPASQRVFISDSNHNRIVVAGMDGQLQDIIGSGRIGRADGGYAEAEFDHPQGMALVGQQLFVADTDNHMIRVVNLETKVVATLAGTGRQGRPGVPPTPSLLTTDLNSPWSIAHTGGVLYIAMAGPHQIWGHRLGTEEIGPWAGSGREDVINGSREESAFAQPSEIIVDDSGNWLYVVDSEGSAVRKVPVDAAGAVSTIAGTSELPRGQSLFAFGDVDAVGAKARFQHPLGIAMYGEKLLVADSYNHKIRSIQLKNNRVSTLVGKGKPGNTLDPPLLNEPGGLSIAGDQLFVADTNNNRICVIDLKTEQMTEFVVQGLTPPSPSKSAAVPEEPNAEELPAASQKSGTPIRVVVDLAITEGYKLNDLAPVTWEVFAIGDQTIVPTEVLGVRDEAVVSDKSAQFVIPVTAEAGTAQLLIRMSYGYCQQDSTLCKLASGAWKLSLTTAEEGSDMELRIRFAPEATKTP